MGQSAALFVKTGYDSKNCEEKQFFSSRHQ
jgi:hypothetical protein